MREALPTLPGLVAGIVGEFPGQGSRGRTLFHIQCSRCFIVEKVDIMPITTIRFHAASTDQKNRRLCAPCRIEVYADCSCWACDDDRREAKVKP